MQNIKTKDQQKTQRFAVNCHSIDKKRNKSRCSNKMINQAQFHPIEIIAFSFLCENIKNGISVALSLTMLKQQNIKRGNAMNQKNIKAQYATRLIVKMEIINAVGNVLDAPDWMDNRLIESYLILRACTHAND